ncbi:centromere protein U [Lates japonicus]|uniref:Centromere protein U n=1 Tax=Lates japonicus TaxID=270547 RepID=A0AAD3RN12_LATJO|nr:centromere protein U [Lates japonicus]
MCWCSSSDLFIQRTQGSKRENTKVGSLIRKKTQRLLDAKHELMRAERQYGASSLPALLLEQGIFEQQSNS